MILLQNYRHIKWITSYKFRCQITIPKMFLPFNVLVILFVKYSFVKQACFSKASDNSIVMKTSYFNHNIIRIILLWIKPETWIARSPLKVIVKNRRSGVVFPSICNKQNKEVYKEFHSESECWLYKLMITLGVVDFILF